MDCGTGKTYPIVFFHFSGIKCLTKRYVNVCSGIRDHALRKALYDRYIGETVAVRSYLWEKYRIEFYTRRTVTKNMFFSVYQRFISPIVHLRSLSDIYRI